MSAHAGLTTERWRSLTLTEQLGNIGSEVGRAINARELGKEARLAAAVERALDLFDLTLADDRWAGLER